MWRVLTYPLSAYGPASVWILLELLVLYWFARDLRTALGARRFWSLLAARRRHRRRRAAVVDAAAR